MKEISLSGFLAKLVTMESVVHHETAKALELAARVVEKEAKAEIGHYQAAAGDFAAWAELAPRTKAERVALGFTENDPLLRTGGLRDSIGHEVEMKGIASGEAVVGSTSDIAVYQELGTERIPPRSFLGGAAVRKSSKVAEICGAGVVKALVGEGVVDRYLKID